MAVGSWNPKAVLIQRDSSGCWRARCEVSKLDIKPAHVCHASSDTHPTPLAARGVIDWEVDYAFFSQVVGRQRGAYHQIAASAKVWGHSFWQQCVWTNITGIIKRCRDVNHQLKCVCLVDDPFFFSPCFVGSSLSIFLLVSLEAFAFWAMLRWKTGEAARVKKLEVFWVLGGDGGSLWCWGVFMEANNTLWYFTNHLCFLKKKNAGKNRQYKYHIRRYKHTNIRTYTQSRASNYHPAERFAVIFVCGYLSSTPHSFWKLQFSWWPMSGSLSRLIFRGR